MVFVDRVTPRHQSFLRRCPGFGVAIALAVDPPNAYSALAAEANICLAFDTDTYVGGGVKAGKSGEVGRASVTRKWALSPARPASGMLGL